MDRRLWLPGEALSIMQRRDLKKQSRYVPHQNLREQARRLKQVRDGQLRGPVVSEEARFMAHGILPPRGV